MMSKVEDEVCKLIQARAKKASIVEKYDGATMERDDLTHDEWLEHLQHELMDAVIYVQRLRTREQTLEAKLRELIAKWGEMATFNGAPSREVPGGWVSSARGKAAMELEALLDEVSE